jgi:hypothetical protein
MLYTYDKDHLQVFDWVKEYSKKWVYGKVWLWTLLSDARACHALPLYALQVATPEIALQPFQG